jgi:pantothenate kinase
MARALVVYESMWGNSERLAQAVADGVAEVMPVDLTDVAAAPTELADVALVIAGGPTHGHTMSRPETRRAARGHGALHGSIGFGLREWLDELPDEHERWLAAFDTCVPTGLRLPASAARSAARVGRRHRFHAAAAPTSFYLLDADGPLAPGELDRARSWGRAVATAVPAADGDAAGGGTRSGSVDAARPDLVLPDPVAPETTREDAMTDPVPPASVDPLPGEYAPTLGALVDRVLALRTGVGAGRPVLVGVTGEPGAGKSTLTASLVAGLRERGATAVLVPMDGFHLANVALAALDRADRKGAIDTFDGAGYAALLTRLRASGPETVWAPTYDRSIEESVAGAIGVPEGTEVVVTEGNYLLVDDGPWSAVRRLLDEVWAVDVDPDVRLARLVARHVEFGKPPERAVAWVESVDVPNSTFVRSTFERADLVVRAT